MQMTGILLFSTEWDDDSSCEIVPVHVMLWDEYQVLIAFWSLTQGTVQT